MSEPRKTRPGITIDAGGRWWYGAEEIVNDSVLAYFKSNLRRDGDRAYYIDNRFGDLREHGYLKRVEGFPLRIESIWLLGPAPEAGQGEAREELELQIRLDSGETLRVPATALTVYDDRTLGLILPERDVPARLGPLAMASLAEHLVESEGAGGYRLTVSGAPPIELQRGDLRELFIIPTNSEYI